MHSAKILSKFLIKNWSVNIVLSAYYQTAMVTVKVPSTYEKNMHSLPIRYEVHAQLIINNTNPFKKSTPSVNVLREFIKN